MGLLTGKNAVVFGVANDRSIAWGITEALHREGATVGLSYAGDMLKKRVMPLAEKLNIDFVDQCDVTKDEDLDATFGRIKERFGTVDILIHSVAFATQDDLKGEYATTSRAGFHLAMDISVYSLVAMAQRVRPLMPNGGSILTMTYYGSEKVMPRYNVMGVAKAALESSVRYLAYDLGAENIRVNAISAGAIKTLAAAGIAGFRDMLRFSEVSSPLRKLVTTEDVGNAALWLCSPYASAITGEVLYVDAGYNIMGLPMAALDEIAQRKVSQQPS
ncbi:MAG: enoyl-ACP reductase [Anaerolineae bacterium]|nr:enoyl-ACP reductase [Anaerolineae bacterium]